MTGASWSFVKWHVLLMWHVEVPQGGRTFCGLVIDNPGAVERSRGHQPPRPERLCRKCGAERSGQLPIAGVRR